MNDLENDSPAEAKPKAAAVVAVERIEAVLKKYKHDCIGKVFHVWEEIKALIAEAKAEAEKAL